MIFIAYVTVIFILHVNLFFRDHVVKIAHNNVLTNDFRL